MLHDAAKWERKKGLKFAPTGANMCADDITNFLKAKGYLKRAYMDK